MPQIPAIVLESGNDADPRDLARKQALFSDGNAARFEHSGPGYCRHTSLALHKPTGGPLEQMLFFGMITANNTSEKRVHAVRTR
jgi:hypothetical protein